MGAGLIAGMGYIAFAYIFALILTLAFVIYGLLDLGEKKNSVRYKSLRVTVPEDIDYSGIFDDIFKEYTNDARLVKVKTTNMGSMFRLTYNISLKTPEREKEMIDRIRERNGNLEVALSAQDMAEAQL